MYNCWNPSYGIKQLTQCHLCQQFIIHYVLMYGSSKAKHVTQINGESIIRKSRISEACTKWVSEWLWYCQGGHKHVYTLTCHTTGILHTPTIHRHSYVHTNTQITYIHIHTHTDSYHIHTQITYIHNTHPVMEIMVYEVRTFYRLLIAVPLKMHSKIDWPKSIMVGQILKLVGKTMADCYF